MTQTGAWRTGQGDGFRCGLPVVRMAEPILAWKPPPKHPWWKFWIRREAPQPLSLGLVVDAERPRLQG